MYTKSSALRMQNTKKIFGEAEAQFRKTRKERFEAGGSTRAINGQENSLKQIFMKRLNGMPSSRFV
jgi:hypothetical protein